MDDDYRTVWVGGLTDDASEDVLYELFLQAGPVEYVKRPKDKAGGSLKPFAFVCFKHDESVPYCIHLLNGVFLYGRPLKVQNRSRESSEHISRQRHKVGIHSLDSAVNASLSSEKPQELLHTRSLSGNFPLVSKKADYMKPSTPQNFQRHHSASFASSSAIPPLQALGGPVGSGSYKHNNSSKFDLRSQLTSNQMNAMKQNFDNQYSLNTHYLQQIRQDQRSQGQNNRHDNNNHQNNRRGGYNDYNQHSGRDRYNDYNQRSGRGGYNNYNQHGGRGGHNNYNQHSGRGGQNNYNQYSGRDRHSNDSRSKNRYNPMHRK